MVDSIKFVPYMVKAPGITHHSVLSSPDSFQTVEGN